MYSRPAICQNVRFGITILEVFRTRFDPLKSIDFWDLFLRVFWVSQVWCFPRSTGPVLWDTLCPVWWLVGRSLSLPVATDGPGGYSPIIIRRLTTVYDDRGVVMRVDGGGVSVSRWRNRISWWTVPPTPSKKQKWNGPMEGGRGVPPTPLVAPQNRGVPPHSLSRQAFWHPKQGGRGVPPTPLMGPQQGGSPGPFHFCFLGGGGSARSQFLCTI